MSKSIKLEWQGAEYFVGESEVFELAGEIEEVVTLGDLARMKDSPKFVKLSKAYAVMLKFAGAQNVTAQQVHAHIMASIKGASEDAKMSVLLTAVSTLMEILMDGAPEQASGDGGKTQAGGS
jgi:hypothetical protein